MMQHSLAYHKHTHTHTGVHTHRHRHTQTVQANPYLDDRVPEGVHDVDGQGVGVDCAVLKGGGNTKHIWVHLMKCYGHENRPPVPGMDLVDLII